MRNRWNIVNFIIVFIAMLGASSGRGAQLEASIPKGNLTTEQSANHLSPVPPKLIHVALLFRHTVRAPRLLPISDPLLRLESFPRGLVRSTRKGLQAARNTSLIWKDWYKNFLTGNPNEVFARSSQAERCYETLAMVLHSWYPSPDDIPLSQVAIRMPPRGTDKYVENCGQMAYTARLYNPQHPIPHEIAKEENFYTVGQYVDFLRNMTGEHNQSLSYFYMAYMEGFVSIDFEHRFTKDDHWILKYPKTREFSRLYILEISIDVLGPYYGHHLLNGIADQLQSSSEGSSKFKLSLFSFHDISVLSCLRALGIRNKAAEPLSTMAFELWKHETPGKTDQFRVALRMSEGLTTNWVYQPDEYLKMKNAGGQVIDELGEVLHIMRTFYEHRLNITNCGYFGNDAKI
ncbi:uncharacterized protein LOC111242851 isoform X2 [Varroa destructor]|uniref:acid phosphatase n=1 Tax=Varroa destructor TaxID=109461 RepID=A0A7M7IWI4_VARDE|nr:uncharacterized protein LOC111242851 isoform X2 [Varroa destructor]